MQGLTNMDSKEKEMPKIMQRGSALKPNIVKSFSKGLKLEIEYKSLSSHVGENSIELSSYLVTITRTHVPIIFET